MRGAQRQTEVFIITFAIICCYAEREVLQNRRSAKHYLLLPRSFRNLHPFQYEIAFLSCTFCITLHMKCVLWKEHVLENKLYV